MTNHTLYWIETSIFGLFILYLFYLFMFYIEREAELESYSLFVCINLANKSDSDRNMAIKW